jgi:hypothetical protein
MYTSRGPWLAAHCVVRPPLGIQMKSKMAQRIERRIEHGLCATRSRANLFHPLAAKQRTGTCWKWHLAIPRSICVMSTYWECIYESRDDDVCSNSILLIWFGLTRTIYTLGPTSNQVRNTEPFPIRSGFVKLYWIQHESVLCYLWCETYWEADKWI